MTPEILMPAPTQPRRRRRQRTSLYLSAVVIALGLLAAAGGWWWAGRSPSMAQAEPASRSEPFSLRGYATLRLPNFAWSADPDVCLGMGSYRDIKQDTPVVVADQSGTIIATGVLGFGEPIRNPADTSRAQSCRLPIVVSSVPADRTFYRITVGTHKPADYNQLDIRGDLVIAID